MGMGESQLNPMRAISSLSNSMDREDESSSIDVQYGWCSLFEGERVVNTKYPLCGFTDFQFSISSGFLLGSSLITSEAHYFTLVVLDLKYRVVEKHTTGNLLRFDIGNDRIWSFDSKRKSIQLNLGKLGSWLISVFNLPVYRPRDAVDRISSGWFALDEIPLIFKKSILSFHRIEKTQDT